MCAEWRVGERAAMRVAAGRRAPDIALIEVGALLSTADVFLDAVKPERPPGAASLASMFAAVSLGASRCRNPGPSEAAIAL